jgi:hypothetical protein
MSCEEINFIYARDEKSYGDRYPLCSSPNATANDYIVVLASFGGHPEEISASLRVSFGMALWLEFMMHLVGVEIYLVLTPKESERLRQVSYERQMERGLKQSDAATL